ncbi:hypothetical protein DSUL_60174 [Desulfovibrionales bacterium]
MDFKRYYTVVYQLFPIDDMCDSYV